MAEPGRLEFAGVLTETLGVTAAKAKVVFPLGFIIYAAPVLALQFWATRGPGGLNDIAMRSLISSFGTLPFSWMLSILVIRQALSETQRSPEPFIDTIRATPALILPIFALSLLSFLGITLATLALIIPGAVLAAAWMVAVPARIAEDIPITKALGRSVVLTRGNRFRIVGLFLIYWASSFVIAFVVGLIVAAIAAVAGADADTISHARQIAATLTRAMAFTVGLVGVTALYAGLRTIQTGSGPNDVAEVFA